MLHKDEEIKKRVVDELYWDNRIDASKVSVTVDEGKVMMTGVVAAMDRDVLVDPEDVTVKVTDGHVKLTGSVPSRVAKDSAHRSAALTYGVVEVENQLRVSA